jgi:glycosyltransferase involved in cell wall biosynthesis
MQEEMTLVLFQLLEFRRLWARRAKVVFFSNNNIGVDLGRCFNRVMWRHTCSGADMALAHSSEVAQVLRRAGFRRPVFVQTEIGVDERSFAPDSALRAASRERLGLDGFVVGFAGQVVKNKGVLDLLDACSLLGGGWKLMIVGDGPLRSAIEQEYSGLLASGRLVMVGHVPLSEMPHYMRAMDCLVLPSRTVIEERFKEQFGLVLAQAMACGVAVVGSSSGAIPEVIGDAGLVFPEGDVGALRGALQRLMDDERLRRDLAQRGLQRCLEKYSATALAGQTFEAFNELVNGNVPRGR